MSHTNSTANLGLPQFIGSDKPTWLSDVNGAFAAIDSYAGSNDAALAITDGKADTAIADASNAVTTAGNAATTAGNAAATATNANTVAGNALTIVNNTAAKMGDLTQLVTTDKSTLVAAINEVAGSISAPAAQDVTYDNTGSGLTATDVQAAIDELAQGGGVGAWTLAGTETGTTPISVPAGSKELLAIVSPTGSESFVIPIPVAALSGTATTFSTGRYISASSNASVSVDATDSQVASSTVYNGGSSVITGSTISLYYR